MKALKIVGIVFLLLVVLVVAGGYFLFSNLNGIVKDLVETKGTQVTMTEVKLNTVDIKLLEGRGQFEGFYIANPSGFTSPNLFQANQLVFDLNLESVNKEVIVIDDLVIDGVNVIAEQKGTTTNIQTILENIKKSSGDKDKNKADEESQGSGQELRFIVKKLRFSDNGVKLISEKYGEYEATMPPVEMQNVGAQQNGLTASELGVAIMQPYLEQAKKAAEKRLQEVAKDKVKSELKKRLGDDADKAEEAIKGLFNN